LWRSTSPACALDASMSYVTAGAFLDRHRTSFNVAAVHLSDPTSMHATWLLLFFRSGEGEGWFSKSQQSCLVSFGIFWVLFRIYLHVYFYRLRGRVCVCVCVCSCVQFYFVFCRVICLCLRFHLWLCIIMFWICTSLFSISFSSFLPFILVRVHSLAIILGVSTVITRLGVGGKSRAQAYFTRLPICHGLSRSRSFERAAPKDRDDAARFMHAEQ
jgi:hypothetical protein